MVASNVKRKVQGCVFADFEVSMGLFSTSKGRSRTEFVALASKRAGLRLGLDVLA